MKSITMSVIIIVTGCYKEIFTPGEELMTPNHPNDYPNSLDCITKIKLDQTERIKLEFSSFSVEERDDCQ